MIKIVTIIGARPQIIKAAAISRAIKKEFSDRITEILVHTGQHYDDNMSKVFFDELKIPHPDYNLGVGSGTHGRQTALMTEGIEQILTKENPDFLLVYGDTNSTLAGGIAASKLHIPVIHVEAGLRSFNKRMPEEINRIVCDHISTLMFTPTTTGLNNLRNEGLTHSIDHSYDIDNPGIWHCGDIMYDNSIFFADLAEQNSKVLINHDLTDSQYILATIHRDNNTDDPNRLSEIFNAFQVASGRYGIKILIPLHPRTANKLETNLEKELYNSIKNNSLISIIEPVSFLDMTMLEKHALMIITDSGGVQKEAYFFNKPCVITRTETEWVEIVDAGAGIVTDADKQKIISAIEYFLTKPVIDYKPVFGDGKAAEFICTRILETKRM